MEIDTGRENLKFELSARGYTVLTKLTKTDENSLQLDLEKLKNLSLIMKAFTEFNLLL